MENLKNESIEVKLLLDAIYMKYGYDFRNYSKASIKRRIEGFLSQSGIGSISFLQHEILYNQVLFGKLLSQLSVNVTQMFRDPDFYSALIKHVIPELKKKKIIKIWHAGCSTGEEVYSLAIILKEEGLYNKCRIYATDMDEIVLQKAKKAIYPIKYIQEYTLNYNKAGGQKSFNDYYTAKYDFAMLDSGLKENILFSNHNLASDSVFGEMDIIICRNVMIYFDRELQERAFKLFKDSLCARGILCLGSKETIRISEYSDAFEDIVAPQKIYRLTK
ncbi:MAG: protein-glutamate O-methyltransferase CheR [Desulfobacterales bacterium]|nr:protein-glutamate O-methyltransferase CheR [Desulfobacterales bacterium]